MSHPPSTLCLPLTCWPRPLRIDLPVMLIDLRLLNAFVLGATILKPYFDLRLRQAQRLGKLEAATPGDVLIAMELHLQAQRLLCAEGGALPALASLLATATSHCKK